MYSIIKCRELKYRFSKEYVTVYFLRKFIIFVGYHVPGRLEGSGPHGPRGPHLGTVMQKKVELLSENMVSGIRKRKKYND